MSQNVSKEIEDEANSYFQRIYNHPPHPTLSIDEVLEMLSKFKESTSKRERVRGHLYSYVAILLNSISDGLIPYLINSDTKLILDSDTDRFQTPLVGQTAKL